MIKQRSSVRRILVYLGVLLLIFGTIPSYAAGSPIVAKVSITDVYVPQSRNSVSTSKWNTSANACYDDNSFYRPFSPSNWPSIDYNNSSGVAAGRDRLLRRAYVEVYVIDSSTGMPMSGQVVTLVSSSLGTKAFIKNPLYTTDNSGIATGYIEFYGKPSLTVTARCGTSTNTSSTFTVGNANYYNRFFVTYYYFPVRSKYSSMDAFKAAVHMEGSGLDDTDATIQWQDPETGVLKNGQWYIYATSPTYAVKAGSTLSTNRPQSASGLWLKAGRSIAVDGNPDTGKQYVTFGQFDGTGSKQKGKVFIMGLADSNGDTGYRIAEDSGGAIRGYHIDLFSGLAPYGIESQNSTFFRNSHPNLPKDPTGESFPFVVFDSIQ